MTDVAAARAWLAALQESIVAALSRADGKAFLRDAWTRPEGGGGVSRLIEEGDLFERGGVNFSDVRGDRMPPAASALRPQLAARRGKPAACRWSCIRAIPTCRPCT